MIELSWEIKKTFFSFFFREFFQLIQFCYSSHKDIPLHRIFLLNELDNLVQHQYHMQHALLSSSSLNHSLVKLRRRKKSSSSSHRTNYLLEYDNDCNKRKENMTKSANLRNDKLIIIFDERLPHCVCNNTKY